MKTTPTQYEQQATDFLSRHGLKIAIKLSNPKEAFWQPAGNHYCVTISKDGGKYLKIDRVHNAAGPFPSHSEAEDHRVFLERKQTRITFDFWGCRKDVIDKHENDRELTCWQNCVPIIRHEIEDLQKHKTFPGARKSCEKRIAAKQVELKEAEEKLAKAEAFEPQHPTPYDVLACISSDVHCPDTFEDFCAEYGEDPDSRKAEQTFRRASAFARKLRAFFTEAEQNELSEIR